MLYTNYTCLIVEDNLPTRVLLASMLKNIGFQTIISAENGKEAWQIIHANAPRIDIVLSDMIMPEADGLQLLRQIRSSKEYWHLPFVMITCVNDMAQIMSVPEEHIDAYLVKPVTQAILQQKVYSAIKKAYDPDPYHAALLKGMKYMHEGLHELALQSLEEARNLQPKQTAAYFNLAQLHEMIGKIDEAEKNYKQCMDRSNELYVKSLDGLARIYHKKGDHTKAMDVLKKAIDISPNTPDRHMDLAVHLKASGKTAEAKSSLARALKLSKTMPKIPSKYMEACLEFGMENDAITLMQQGVSDDSVDIVYLNKLGIACRRSKAFDLAKNYYQRALKIAPDDETLNYNYAVLLIDLQDYKAARSHLYQVLRKNHDSEEALSLIIKLDNDER